MIRCRTRRSEGINVVNIVFDKIRSIHTRVVVYVDAT